MENRENLILRWIIEGISVDEIIIKLRDMNIPTAKKTVRKILKEKGFEYSKQEMKWVGPDTLDDLIETNVGDLSSQNEIIEIQSETLPTNAITLLDMLGLKPQQLNALKTLADERLDGQKNSTDIHDAITGLRFNDRKNKTFYISRELSEDAVLFCERQGIKISSLIEVALIETMNKYKK